MSNSISENSHSSRPCVSIFNDVIGPVMRGASSSHCAAALRIGRIARDLMDGNISDVVVEYDSQGSLAGTHESQGSDMGLFGGLMGWNADDERLPGSAQALAGAGITCEIKIADIQDPHPSTYHLHLKNDLEQHTLTAVSTGGGMIEVISIDGLPLRMDGGYCETLVWLEKGVPPHIEADEVFLHEADTFNILQIKAAELISDDVLVSLRPIRVRRIARVLPVGSRKDMSVPFTTCREMLAFDGEHNTSLWELASVYESARGGIGELEVMERMENIVQILRRSLASGLAGTSYSDRVLGCQSDGFKRALREGRLLDAGALNTIILYVSALMEVKSSMGVIVAMPTAGSCAALPSAVIALAEEMDLGDEEIAQAFLAAGLVGVFIASKWTFAAEVGGCQAECGSASAITAAALVTLAGGTLAQCLAGASMAMQSMLGLICDPVANRVEVPCLGKNAMAAANALTCANMALAGYNQVVPLDEVIDAARTVSGSMPRELRCTALGGLSLTKASRDIEVNLAGRKLARSAEY